MSFDYRKSIDFLLEHSRKVIQYRLHKELLRNLTEAEEAALLEKVMSPRLPAASDPHQAKRLHRNRYAFMVEIQIFTTFEPTYRYR